MFGGAVDEQSIRADHSGARAKSRAGWRASAAPSSSSSAAPSSAALEARKANLIERTSLIKRAREAPTVIPDSGESEEETDEALAAPLATVAVPGSSNKRFPCRIPVSLQLGLLARRKTKLDHQRVALDEGMQIVREQLLNAQRQREATERDYMQQADTEASSWRSFVKQHPIA